jgi:hypothetical protein
MTERARTLPQSAKFHALCGEVARQATFGGRKLSGQQWKVLFCSALAIIDGDDPDLVQGLAGEFVALRESTARMSAARMNNLIEYASCWAAENGIKLTK